MGTTPERTLRADAGSGARHILVFSDGARQAAGLATALRRAGCRASVTPLSAACFDTTAPTGIILPGFEGSLPDAVLVRSIAAGSFEAVTRRLGLLHALARLGVPVWNSAAAIERCVDKSMTSFLIADSGLPTPATFTVEHPGDAAVILARELPRGPLVLKPLFGAQGRGIRLIRSPDDLPASDEVAGVYYLQRLLDRDGPPYRDYRVLVCAGRAVAMMARRSEDWITNIDRGATPEPVSGPLRARLADLAVAAAHAVGADFAGVDIARLRGGGLSLIEVNSMPAWAGLQSVTSTSIAGAIVGSLLNRLDARRDKLRPHATRLDRVEM